MNSWAGKGIQITEDLKSFHDNDYGKIWKCIIVTKCKICLLFVLRSYATISVATSLVTHDCMFHRNLYFKCFISDVLRQSVANIWGSWQLCQTNSNCTIYFSPFQMALPAEKHPCNGTLTREKIGKITLYFGLKLLLWVKQQNDQYHSSTHI